MIVFMHVNYHTGNVTKVYNAHTLAAHVLCGNCLVLKVLKIEEKQFTEVCNLRIREMVNLSYSATDVAWSPLDGCMSLYLYNFTSCK